MAAADAQYAIDIATAMPDGEATIAELDALTQGLIGAGRDAEHFQVAIKRVSAELDAAKRANAAAAAALAEGATEYKVLERAALQASKAAEKMARANGGIVTPEVFRQMEDANAAVNAHAVKLRELEAASKRASAAETKHGATLKNLSKLHRHTTEQLGKATTRLSTFRGALGDVGGPLGEFGERLLFPAQAFVDLNEIMGKSKAIAVVAVVGIAAITAAIALLTVAAIAGTVALAAWAVKLGDARREAGLAREAAEALHPDLVALRAPIQNLSDETGLSGEALRKLAGDLRGAKVAAEDMPAALRAAALAETALGAGGASTFVRDIKDGKLAVDQFAATAEQKFGGIVARQMLGLEAQGQRLKRNMADIFGALNIDPALEGVRVLVGLFDRGTASGEAMALLFEGIFQPIIDQAKNAALVVEAFVIGFLIGLTKVYIALKPAIAAIGEFFGFDDVALGDVLKLVTKAGEYAAYVFVGFVAVLGLLVAGFLATAAAIAGAVAAPFALAAAIVYLGVTFTEAVFGAVQSAIDWLGNVDLYSIGVDMLKGLANGITGGGAALIGAITGAVGGAIKAAESMLGIASPSKVFRGMGRNSAESYGMGVDDGAPEAHGALERLASPEATTPLLAVGGGGLDGATQSAPAAAPAPAGAGASLSNVVFNFYGVEGAQDAEGRLSEVLTRILEGDAAALGAPA